MPQIGTSTADHARSMRLVSDTITVMPTSTRSLRRNRQPSRSRSRYGVGSVSSSEATGRVRAGMAPGQQECGDPERRGVDDQCVGRCGPAVAHLLSIDDQRGSTFGVDRRLTSRS
jgi:hypothetical protein